MALVKKSAIVARASRSKLPADARAEAPPATVRKPRPRRAANATERLDHATQELAAGLGEAAAAAAELQRAVDQISSGAEEAAGAAQESFGLIGALRGAFRDASDRANASLRQAEFLQTGFSEAAAQIDGSVAAITLNASRQRGSITIVERLEAAAGGIAAVGATVGDLSEQTGMLALNASIEAVRAGDGGKGFAIVADEVRELAESAEKSAIDIRALAERIVGEIREVAQRIVAASERAESEAGQALTISADLQAARNELGLLISGAQDIASAAIEADGAASEAERGAEQVASAAEEQSAAAAEAQQAITQQATSLDESQQTAEALGALAADIGAGASGDATDGVAAAAEQLSATVQELSGASGEILVAIEQIARGAQLQSAATIEAATAMAQIERSALLADSRARAASDRVEVLVALVDRSRNGVGGLVAGVTAAVEETRVVLDRLAGVGDTARLIEKISDGLALVALQTNMLGVSGTVEATRAGDAGAGFATVTADIRKLARESAANADEAKDVVRAIQDQLAVIRRDLDQIVAAGETEAGRNQAVIDRFGMMVTALGETKATSVVVSERADAILQSAREVKGGCDQIATAAELAAGAAREAGVAARQQAQSAEDLAAAIEDIAALAASLAGKSA